MDEIMDDLIIDNLGLLTTMLSLSELRKKYEKYKNLFESSNSSAYLMHDAGKINEYNFQQAMRQYQTLRYIFEGED